MRWSMSKKLFLVMGMLILVAIAILILGVYSINSLNNNAADLGLLAKRAINVSDFDKFALERSMSINALIRSEDEAEMQALFDGPIKESEKHMEDEIQSYVANFPENPSDELKANPGRVRAVWAEYVSVTDEVAKLSIGNSKKKANDIADGNFAFWQSVSADLQTLADSFTDDDAANMRRAIAVLEIRQTISYYQYLMERYINKIPSAEKPAVEKEIGDSMYKVEDLLEAMAKGLKPGKDRDLTLDLLQRIRDVGGATHDKIVELVILDSNGKAGQLVATVGMEKRDRLFDTTGDLLALNVATVESSITESAALARNILLIMIIASGVGIVVGVVFAWYVISGINRSLRNIIATLRQSSDHVFTASSQISGSSQSLAEGATEQAASLEETSSALEQMASMTRQNADNAGKTQTTTDGTQKLIAEGAVAVNDMSEAMGQINDSAEQISRIIKTIEDIAFQTNLLALNAAVEAARAGEAGKGFAVVADEVRNLAQRSAQAAKDTTDLIQGTVERVTHGAAIATNLTDSFSKIENGAKSVANLVVEIAGATAEQAQGVDQVNTAVAQMDKVTQQNAASAEESASAAEDLSGQAASLNGMVDTLVSLVEGGKTGGNGNGHYSPRDNGGGNGKRTLRVNHVSDAYAEAPRTTSATVLSPTNVLTMDDGF